MKQLKNSLAVSAITAVLLGLLLLVGCGSDDSGKGNENEATVTYVANAESFTGTVPAPEMVTKGDVVILPASSGTFNQTDKEISVIGWNTKADGSGTWYNIREKVMVNENMTLYAQWEEWGNVKIAFYLGAARDADGKNILLNEWVEDNASFKASIDKAYMIAKYPYFEAGHFTDKEIVSSMKGLRHAAESIELTPDIDLTSPDLSHPVCATFAVDLRKADDSYMGTVDELQSGDLLQGGEYGEPWMRIFWPGKASEEGADNAANWWSRMIDVDDSGAKQVLQDKDAGVYLSGKLQAGSKDYTYEVISQVESFARPSEWDAYYLRSGETLNIKWRTHTNVWLKLLETYKVDFDALDALDGTADGKILFSAANLLTYAPGVALPDGKTLMDLINTELISNGANWDFNGNTITR